MRNREGTDLVADITLAASSPHSDGLPIPMSDTNRPKPPRDTVIAQAGAAATALAILRPRLASDGRARVEAVIIHGRERD
jgi:hypothetical protein